MFDAGFYASQWAGALDPGEATLDHYRRLGAPLGLCPGPDFDPVAYRIAHPGEAGDALELFQAAASKDPGRRPPSLGALFPDVPVVYRHSAPAPGLNLVRHDRCTAEQARSFAQEDSLELSFPGGTYRLHAPAATLLLDRLEADSPLSLLRYPHGCWSLLSLLARVRGALAGRIPAGLLSGQELTSAAIRLCRQRLPESVFARDALVDRFLAEIEEDLQSPLPEGVCCGVSFKGYPTLDARPFIRPGQGPENDPFCAEQAEAFSAFFAPGRPLLDGTLLKRWAVSGALQGLPDRLRPHPVVLAGPPWFSSFGRRLGLDRFRHVSIHFRGTFLLRHQLLGRILDALRAEAGGRRPVVLLQCGGSLAAWLIRRLHRAEPGAFYWDFGQALNLWHLDEAFYDFPWIRVYKEAMVRNNGLEPLYRQLTGAHYEQWIHDRDES